MRRYTVETKHRETGTPGPTIEVEAPDELAANDRFAGTTLVAVSIRPAPPMTAVPPPSSPRAPEAYKPRTPHGEWYNGPWGSVVRIAIMVLLLGGMSLFFLPAACLRTP